MNNRKLNLVQLQKIVETFQSKCAKFCLLIQSSPNSKAMYVADLLAYLERFLQENNSAIKKNQLHICERMLISIVQCKQPALMIALLKHFKDLNLLQSLDYISSHAENNPIWCLAIRFNSIPLLNTIINSKQLHSYTYYHDMSAITIAVHYKNPIALQMMIQAGLDANYATPALYNPLQVAISESNLAMVTALIKGGATLSPCPIIEDSYRKRHGSLDGLNELLKNGGPYRNLSALSPKDYDHHDGNLVKLQPLVIAARRNELEILKVLTNIPFIDSEDMRRQYVMALWGALENGHYDCFSHLLSVKYNGQPVISVDTIHQGMPLLFKALSHSNFRFLFEVLRNNPNILIRSNSQETILHQLALASGLETHDIIWPVIYTTILKNLRTDEALFQFVNQKEESGNTALSLALVFEQTETVRCLLTLHHEHWRKLYDLPETNLFRQILFGSIVIGIDVTDLTGILNDVVELQKIGLHNEQWQFFKKTIYEKLVTKFKSLQSPQWSEATRDYALYDILAATEELPDILKKAVQDNQLINKPNELLDNFKPVQHLIAVYSPAVMKKMTADFEFWYRMSPIFPHVMTFFAVLVFTHLENLYQAIDPIIDILIEEEPPFSQEKQAFILTLKKIATWLNMIFTQWLMDPKKANFKPMIDLYGPHLLPIYDKLENDLHPKLMHSLQMLQIEETQRPNKSTKAIYLQQLKSNQKELKRQREAERMLAAAKARQAATLKAERESKLQTRLAAIEAEEQESAKANALQKKLAQETKQAEKKAAQREKRLANKKNKPLYSPEIKLGSYPQPELGLMVIEEVNEFIECDDVSDNEVSLQQQIKKAEKRKKRNAKNAVLKEKITVLSNDDAIVEKCVVPVDILAVFNRFKDINAQFYLVGGAVLRALKGDPAEGDYDLISNCNPQDLLDRGFVASRFVPHLYRYKDNHIEIDVVVTPTPLAEINLYEDIKKRDLTIGAIFLDVQGNIYDPCGQGFADFKLKQLNLIGDPELALDSDPVRALRIARYVVQQYQLSPLLQETLSEWQPQQLTDGAYQKLKAALLNNLIKFQENQMPFLNVLITYGLTHKLFLLPSEAIDPYITLAKLRRVAGYRILQVPVSDNTNVHQAALPVSQHPAGLFANNQPVNSAQKAAAKTRRPMC